MSNTLSLSYFSVCNPIRKFFSLRLLALVAFLAIVPGLAFAQITGPSFSACVGSSVTLSGPGSGTWSSSNTSVAAIGSSSGIVLGIGPGVATITFTGGTTSTLSFTVNPLPSLHNVTGGGTMCAGGPGFHVGLDGSSSGINYQLIIGGSPSGLPIPGTGSGIDYGPQTVGGTYTVVATNTVTACSQTMTDSVGITVNPTPSPIAGPAAVCAGATAAETSSPSGGTWTSSNPSVGSVGTTGVVTGIANGTTTISYTVSGCYAISGITVTTSVCPLASLPPLCISSPVTLTDCVSGGSWSSTSAVSIGSLSGLTTGLTPGTDTITYSLGGGCTTSTTLSVISSPASIAGSSVACIGSTVTLSDSTTSGTWASSAPAVGTVSAGGVFTAVGTGTTTISYSVGACAATKIITVNPTPSGIGGPSQVCVGSTVAETDTVSGGVWSISPAIHATVDTAGVVTGVGFGLATVTYSLGGCIATKTLTINVVSPITGSTGLCVGATTTLSDLTPGGTWSSGNTSVATIGGTGIVSGVAAGTAPITYVSLAGCTTSTLVTVAISPGPISGPLTICNGSCTPLSGTIPGGIWSSSIPALASVGSASGTVCGLAPGVVTITYLNGGCAATASVTVNPAPAAISGPTSACVGQTVTYTDVFSGGTWASGSTSVATIGSSGMMTAVSSGTVIISYSFPSGCTAILPVVIYPFTPVSGPSSVCIGQTINLTDPTPGGSWTSSAPGIAVVSPAGVVSGVAAGTATITYTLPGGCLATASITVNALPAAIGGPTALCEGVSATLTDATPGGFWSSSNLAVVSITGSGAITGVSAGTAIITYGFPGGCLNTRTITVNPLPAAISGGSTACVAGTLALTDAMPGGTWTSGTVAVATVGSAGLVTGISPGTSVIGYSLPTGCATSTTVTIIAGLAPITGGASVCVSGTSLLSDGTPGGTWSSSNTAVANVNPSTGLVSGVAPGVSLITYATGTSGCNVSLMVTVHPLPSAISGSTLLCPGAATTLADFAPGGTWTSSAPSVAAIGSSTGVVTGLSAGLSTVDYALATGCTASITVSVHPAPAAITGTPMVCVGLLTFLSDATPGGTWSSSNSGVAPVGPTGAVTGLSLGVATISYTSSLGCAVTLPVAVNPPPAPITGATTLCMGLSTLFTDAVPGGVWTSSNPSIALAGSTTGIIVGIAAGAATITYSTGVGCQLTRDVTVNTIPAAISGPGNVCEGSTISLTDITTGGVWTSGAPTLATVSTTGTVTGLSAGIVAISYTLGCSVTRFVTVNPMPAAITGTLNTCIGGTTALTDAVPGGTWTSSIPSVATIGSSSGIVTGAAAGATVIRYTLAGGCFTSVTVNAFNPPTAFIVTGGGNYCSGDSGVHIVLTGSQVGVNYFLYVGTTPTGTFAGTGGPVDFGWQTVAGIYTVTGTATISGCTVNMTGTATIGIIPTVTPAITCSVTPGDTVCSGTTVNFVATATNGGFAPVYAWYVNGIAVSSAPSYSYIPVAGDVVKVKLTSVATCASPDTAVHSVAMTVNLSAAPHVTLSATPGDTVCKGTVVTVSAGVTYGGATPSYQWMKNGALTGTGTFYSFIPSDNDVVRCILTSNYPCRTADVDTSSPLRFKVDTPMAPVISITATPGTLLSPGQADTLIATATNGGASPSWQWYLNGVPIPGATSNTLIIDTFTSAQVDSFTCRITSSGPCVLSSTQLIYISVVTVGVPSLTTAGAIVIHPNPSKGRFTIEGNLAQSATGGDEFTMEITDVLGRSLLCKSSVTQNGRINEEVILPGAQAAGIYFLTIINGTERMVYRILIE